MFLKLLHDLILGWSALFGHPLAITLFVTTYSIAFLLRSAAWRTLLPRAQRVGVGRLFTFHMAGLFLNHLLPSKAGDAARVFLLTRASFSWGEAASSVFSSRLVDLIGLALVGGFAGLWTILAVAPDAFVGPPSPVYVAIGILLALVIGGAIVRRIELPVTLRAGKLGREIVRFLESLKSLSSNQLLLSLALTCIGWTLECFTLYAVLWTRGIPLEFTAIVAVTAITLVGQVFQVTPGGVGSYEGIMTALLHGYGIPIEMGLVVATLTHLLKFAYAFIAGGAALLVIGIGLAELRMGAGRTKAKEREASETSI